jgi:hypothetical protein
MSVISTQASTVIAIPVSGDYRVDVLLDGPGFRWNAPAALKTPVTLTYSFAETVNYLSGDDAKGFLPFTQAQRKAAKETLDLISAQFNINFSEVNETSSASTTFGQLRFSNVTTAAAGYAKMPAENGASSPGDNSFGDNFINNDPKYLTDYTFLTTQGAFNWSLMIHEVLHSLGLKHPGNYNGGEPPSNLPGNYLVKTEDNQINSVLSYVDNSQGLQRIDLGVYDMLAMSYLYGAKAFRVESNQYVFSNTSANQAAASSANNLTNKVLVPDAGRFLQLINDTGGNNSFDFQSMTDRVIVNLGQGQSSSAGFLADGTTEAINNIQIAVGTEINTVIGSKFNDQLTGNSGVNLLEGGPGNDTIDGGLGIDTSKHNKQKSNYSLKFTSPTNISLTDISGSQEIDTLVSIERLKFSDTSLAIDLGGNAGTAVKILGAVFGKESVNNKNYVGICLSLLDSGMTYGNLAGLALGAAGAITNDQIVSLLWTNVTGTKPTTADKQPFIDLLDKGLTAGALAQLAADTSLNTTNINLVGLAQTGIEYTPAV